MKSLIVELDKSPPVKNEDTPKTTHFDDLLGSMLQGKWLQWSTAKLSQEQIWLEDLRAFNQKNDPGEEQLTKFHSHIYIGLTRTKVTGSYNRIEDLLFQSRKHWGITPTPIPECDKGEPGSQEFMDAMQKSAELMETEISDQLLDLKYDTKLKSCILEGCILGTGVIKGIIPGTRKLEKWGFIPDQESGIAAWDLVKSEIPYPEMSAPSVFNIFPDPYANSVEDMSGVFERHTINRAQFSELKDDPNFDDAKINEILEQSESGNHVNLYHETERRNIANTITTANDGADKYDLLEYWGQVSGRMLSYAGVEDAEVYETYWANVWVCSGKTLLARVMPMKRQRIPYNFFIYSRQPHQFWGCGPGRMMRNSQKMINGSTRLLLDGMALAAIPMSETNVDMLQDGQDPTIMKPGQNWLRDHGDPTVPAVRFFQPNIPTGALIQLTEMCKQLASEESNIPAFSYGQTSDEINKTSSGMSMQLNAASSPIKAVVKSLEDQVIKPVITSLYDWNMEWNANSEIKGDHEIQVLGSGQLIAKEQKAQALMQFANITQNPLDLNFVDRKYLLEQIVNSMELDVKKIFPDQLPPQQTPPPPTPSPTEIAKADLIQAQMRKELELTKKAIAETANVNINSQFSAAQTAQVLLTNPQAEQGSLTNPQDGQEFPTNRQMVTTADALLISAGYQDADGNGTMAPPMPAQGQELNAQVPQNTHPNFPASPETGMQAMQGPMPSNNVPKEMKAPDLGASQGIETVRQEPLASAG